MHRTKFVVCHATPRTSDTSGRRLGSWHCRPHGAGGQSRRPHSTSDSEQIGSSLDKGRGEPETTPNRSTSISPGPGRMRPMSLANGMQNPHSPSLPASHSQSQRLPGREAIQMNTDRTQTAWSSSEADPFFPLLYTEPTPTSEADLLKCSRRKVLKSRLTVNIPFITTEKNVDISRQDRQVWRFVY